MEPIEKPGWEENIVVYVGRHYFQRFAERLQSLRRRGSIRQRKDLLSCDQWEFDGDYSSQRIVRILGRRIQYRGPPSK
jgi:hypothetical protein